MDAVMELEIGPGPESGSYVVRVLRSVGGGEPTEAIALDVDELVDRRPELEASVLLSSVSARRIMTDTEAALQAVGRRLFEAVFIGDVYAAYRTSVAVASERGTGVRIALRLTAPGLAALPWEALFDPSTETYLCRKEPLVRHVPAPPTAAALAIELPLRVLAMVSSPRGLPPLDVEHERELLEEALRPHLDAGRVQVEWLEPVTWPRVHDKLLEQEWHVLHFIGHGTYDVDTDEGVLAFVGRDGRADYVAASSLADLLAEAEPTPRLVLLNSCRSAAGGRDDLFSGTAAALAHSGIHAVAAMQFSISDTAAIEFSRGFYSALAHGRGIDEAVRSGRIGILGLGRGTLEWVTPVLYLRGEDTRLFDVAQPAEAADARASADRSPRDPGTSGPSRDPTPAAGKRRRRTPWLVAGLVALGAVVALGAALLLPQWIAGGSGGGPGGGSDADRLFVRMDQDWTSTGVSCEEGDTIRISARGEGVYDETEAAVGPNGLTTGELGERRVFRNIESFALIGKLHTQSEAFFVGVEQQYVCPSAGELLLGPNDNLLDGNRGGWDVTVQLDQDT
ncbi:CHAT domain-containing protein [Agromyces mariniharenae]|uniref:CHAT domain-containing protein n=1 Tax=Agromyces mariniharenae TaxID=2604423 RepID=A0A5S4V7W3_9MICO|nr:CHAT domain-containing protein [Agromyces mariniharenae]TYL53371.1 CHAT domain-containing protein [Agromyces mariniharenae]